MEKHTVTSTAAHTIAQVGGITAVSSGMVGWLTENHIVITSAGVLVGILVGFTGIYVQLRKAKLEREETRLRIARLQAKI